MIFLHNYYHIKMKLTADMQSFINKIQTLLLFFLKGNLTCHFSPFLPLVLKCISPQKNKNKKHVQRERRKELQSTVFFKLQTIQKSVTINVTILVINKVLFFNAPLKNQLYQLFCIEKQHTFQATSINE